MRPEETIEKKFVEECKKIGVLAYKLEIEGMKGAPDRMCLLPNGKAIFVEFKRPNGGSIAEHQKRFLQKLVSFGFDAFVADSWEYPLLHIKGEMYE